MKPKPLSAKAFLRLLSIPLIGSLLLEPLTGPARPPTPAAHLPSLPTPPPPLSEEIAFQSPLPTPSPPLSGETTFQSPLPTPLPPLSEATTFQSPLPIPKEVAATAMARSLQEGWRLVYNPPAVALFSGGATYEYSLDLPPGRGNLRPTLRLSYNSRRVDGILAWVQDWVGIGWSVDLMDIVRDEARYCDSPTICLGERFLLVMNGTGYELEPPPGSSHGAAGRYYAKDAPQLWIQFIKGDPSAPNEKKSYWLVRAPDGTTYRLGYTWNSEQVLPYVDGAEQDPARAVYRWRLDQVEDVYGNRMEVSYREWGDNHNNRASVLAEIRYNNYGGGWGTRISFFGSDFQYESGPIFYDPQSLQRIEVWHAGQKIRTYQFSYGESTQGRRVLQGIRVLGRDGQLALPATRFGYEDYHNKAWCGNPCGYCIPGHPKYDAYRCDVFVYPRLK